MASYIKTTALLLFLLCVAKLIQAKHVESANKLKSSNDSEEVEQKVNISEGLTLKSLEKRTENAEKTTENSAKETEEKKRTSLQDEIKRAEEKKGNHPLRRRRRSHTVADSSVENNSMVGLESKDYKNDFNASLDLPQFNDLQTLRTNLSNTNDDKDRFFLINAKLLTKAFSLLINRSEGSTIANTKQANEFFTKLINLFDIYPDALSISPHLQEDMKKLLKNFDHKNSSDLPQSDDAPTLPTDLSNTSNDNKRFLGVIWRAIVKVFKWLFGRSEGITSANTKQVNEFFTKLINLLQNYAGTFNIPPNLQEETKKLLKNFDHKNSSDLPQSDDAPTLPTDLSNTSNDNKRFLGVIWRAIVKVFKWLFGRSEGIVSANTKQVNEFFTKLIKLLQNYAGAFNVPHHLQEDMKKLLKNLNHKNSSDLPQSDAQQTLRMDFLDTKDDEDRFFLINAKLLTKAFSLLINRSEGSTIANTKQANEFFTKLINLFDTYPDALSISPHLQEDMKKLLKNLNHRNSSDLPQSDALQTLPTDLSNTSNDNKRFLGVIWRAIVKVFKWLFDRSEGSTSANTKQVDDFFVKLINLLQNYAGTFNIPPNLQEETKKLLKNFDHKNSSDLPQSDDAPTLPTDLSNTSNDNKRFFGVIWRSIVKVFKWLYDRSERNTIANTKQVDDFFVKLINLLQNYAGTFNIPPNLQEDMKKLLKNFDHKNSSDLPQSDDAPTLPTDLSNTSNDNKRFLGVIWRAIVKVFKWLFGRSEGIVSANTKQVNEFFTKLIKLLQNYAGAFNVPHHLQEDMKKLLKNFDHKNSSDLPQSDDVPTLPTDLSNTSNDNKRFLGVIWRAIVKVFKWLFGRSEGIISANTKQVNEFFTKLIKLLQNYAGAFNVPHHLQEDMKKLLKNFDGEPPNEDSATKSGPAPEADKDGPTSRSQDESSPFNTLPNFGGKPLESDETGSLRSSEDEEPYRERIWQRYCELREGSNNIITTLKTLVKEFDVSYKSDNGRRGNSELKKFVETLWVIYKKNGGSKKRSGYDATFIKEAISKYCEGLKLTNSHLTATTEAQFYGLPVPENKRSDSENESIYFQSTHARGSVRPKVRTNAHTIHLVSEEQQKKRSEYDDAIGWRHWVFKPDKDQKVSKKQTKNSSPKIIKKSKIKRLKKPKNLKSRLLNLYNGRENGTGTRGQTSQFSKPKIIGHKRNSSTLFEVKTGVERETGSKDSNPRLRCNVRTKGSMSDADGRTGSSKGRTFSEVPSNDTKTLFCSSETSEIYRPSKDVLIKQSVSGKSVVSYGNPDKYIGHNYSPLKENLEIGTSGFSTLNDTSNKNQSVSLVSTDSQNADSVSRSETKFVLGKGNQKGIESSANVEGLIDAILNKHPFIMNGRQHSLGMIVENPARNMESPLLVGKNEKLQTYSKFERTEDFDINFRSLDSKRPDFHHRRRPR